MRLIVGLGNPEKRFRGTRHNLGFIIVESLKSKVKSFSDWKNIKKFQSQISKGKIFDEEVILAKPQAFMNNSGKVVKLLTKSYKLKPKNLIIVHDDIDLPLGKIKIVKNRESAGHKGVQSIIDELGTKNFVRFRIGIKPETRNKRQETKVEKFVLQKFTKKEKEILKEVIKKTPKAIETAISKGIGKAMNEFNK